MDERVQEDVIHFRNMLQEISHTYKYISDGAIEDYVHNIKDILMGYCNIQDRFNIIGYGAYRECYTLNGDFVIKFVSEQNDTKIEEMLMLKAAEANVGEIFIPTWYYYLSSTGPELFTLDEEASDRGFYNYEEHTWVDNPDYTFQRATCIIIQPCILRTVGEKAYLNFPYDEFAYNKNPITDNTNKIVDYQVARSFWVTSQTWLQDIVDTYGLEFFNRLEKFLSANEVHDLHSDNIGYYINKDGKVVPVIFDCLSRGC